MLLRSRSEDHLYGRNGLFFFFQAEDGIRDADVTGVQTCALPISAEAEVRTQLGAIGKGGNVAAATLIGKRIAEKAKAAGVEKVAFDRAGFAYHGRVKALAEAAREAGLQF